MECSSFLRNPSIGDPFAFHIFSHMEEYGSRKMSVLGFFHGFYQGGELIWAGFCSSLGHKTKQENASACIFGALSRGQDDCGA
jgi:hypothetical protein